MKLYIVHTNDVTRTDTTNKVQFATTDKMSARRKMKQLFKDWKEANKENLDCYNIAITTNSMDAYTNRDEYITDHYCVEISEVELEQPEGINIRLNCEDYWVADSLHELGCEVENTNLLDKVYNGKGKATYHGDHFTAEITKNV